MSEYIARVAQIVARCQLAIFVGGIIAMQFTSPSCPHETFADGVATVFVWGWMASAMFLTGLCAFLLKETP